MIKKEKSVKSLKKFLNKQGDMIVVNPEIESKPGINEAAGKAVHAVMAFGRMNPPTTGHAALVDKMHEVAKQHKASHVLVASHSQDAKKNPLSGEDKVKHLKRYFPNTHIELSNKEHPTFLQQAAKLHKSGATHLHMIAGSDRVDEYKEKLHKYNGKGEGKLFNFKHIEVHSSGERDPDAEGTAGMSASKMREHASHNDFKSFKKGVPGHVTSEHAKELFHDTRKGMKLEEAVLDIGQRRKRSISFKRRQPQIQRQKVLSLKRFANELKLRRRAQSVARNLVRTRVAGKRGANYANLSTSDKMSVDRMIQGKQKLIKSLAAKLYQKVRRREAARVASVRSGHTRMRSGGRIINASFDYELFSKMYDNANHYQLAESDLFALGVKARKTGIDLTKLQEEYIDAVSEYEYDEKITQQQYAFNRVNAYICAHKLEEQKKDNIGGFKPSEHQANVLSLKQHVKKIEGKKSKVVWNPDTRKYKVVYEEEEIAEGDVQSHLKAATIAQQKGKPQTANMHRKIASALQRGDKTTAQGFQQQLHSINESFVIDRTTGLGVTYFANDLGIKTQGGFAHHPSVLAELIERGELEGEELEAAIEEMRKCNYGKKAKK